MARNLFGTDGIRGVANEGQMTPEIAFRIGAAITYQLRKRVSHMPRVVIGKDTRLSGYLFEQAISAGVCSQGGHVMLSGPLPTPAIAHLTTSMRADAGVVISASHNPYQDNGIKIFGADGYKLPDAAEEDLETLIEGTEIDRNRPTGTGVGRAERLDDAPGRYVAFVKQTFPNELTLEGLRIVVDAAHGAAYKVAPAVFYELGAEVHSIGVRPNGKNINRKHGAVHPEACAREVVERRADLGIALDGDADRVVVIDGQGRIVDGDAVMALCATRMLERGALRKKTLVTTVMSNLGLERAVKRAGGG
ncbi:MAG: phosphoglucosamine mutase, partial [Sandaracinaceae bacterium]|nr:phosphoglucosamine mutase [Sandaracinaceae bacterium]